MRIRQAKKIISNASYGHKYGKHQLAQALRIIWHRSRYVDGPCEGQRMRLSDSAVNACVVALVRTGKP